MLYFLKSFKKMNMAIFLKAFKKNEQCYIF